MLTTDERAELLKQATTGDDTPTKRTIRALLATIEHFEKAANAELRAEKAEAQVKVERECRLANEDELLKASKRIDALLVALREAKGREAAQRDARLLCEAARTNLRERLAEMETRATTAEAKLAALGPVCTCGGTANGATSWMDHSTTCALGQEPK